MSIFKKLNPAGDDRGVTMVEYGLLVAVIALIASSTVMMMGHETEETFDTIAASIDEAHDGSGSVSSAAGSDDGSGGDGASKTEEEETSEEEEEKLEELEKEAEKKAEEEAEEAEKEAEEAEKEAEEAKEEDEESEKQGEKSKKEKDSKKDEEAEEEKEESDPLTKLGGTAEVSGSEGEFSWWTDTPWNKNMEGRGAWTASVTYSNDWKRHQYLTLEVTRKLDNGATKTSTVKSFYVPAGGSATYSKWSNSLKKMANGKTNGVVEVTVEVTHIRTKDGNWKRAEFELDDGPVTVIEAPSN